MKKRKSPEQTMKKPSGKGHKVQRKEEAMKKPSGKRHKVQTKEETKDTKSEKIVQVERIVEDLEILPEVLHPLISGYWWNDNPFEKKWLIFERFCDGQFDKFLEGFQKETWSPASSSKTMKKFIESLEIFKEKVCDIDLKKSNDPYYLLVELGKTLLGDEVVQKQLVDKLENQVKKENLENFLRRQDLEAWLEGKYDTKVETSLPSFLLKKRALKDTDPTTVMLYYFLWSGYSGATSFVDYMAFQLGLFYGKKGFLWFLFVGLHGVWLSQIYVPKCFQQQLGCSSEFAMEGAFPCENHAQCWFTRLNKDS